VKSRNGQRNGPRLGFPKFKAKRRCRDSFRFSTGTVRCSGATVTLPRLGAIATHEPTGKLANRLEAGTARILSATVSRTAQRWFVSFTVQAERAVPEHHSREGKGRLFAASDPPGRVRACNVGCGAEGATHPRNLSGTKDRAGQANLEPKR